MGFWFGRILTFELSAEEEDPEIGAIVEDASFGAIDCTDERAVIGYAAHGPSIRSAIDPLVEQFGIDLADDGAALRSPDPLGHQIIEEDLGCSSSGERVARMELTQTPARELPRSLALTYYDPERDYQTGLMRASTGGGDGPHDRADTPIVLPAADAKALAETLLARRWARRDRLTLRLPPRFITVRPGSFADVAGQSGLWRVERVGVDGFVAILEINRSEALSSGLPSDPGRNLPGEDEVAAATHLALLDLPDLGDGARGSLSLHLAAANSSKGWRAVPIEIAGAGSTTSGQTASSETVLGASLTAPGPGQPWLFDMVSSFDVELIESNHWLESCEDSAMISGANLAVLGDEVIQFGLAEPIGPKRFRLSRLLRGRRGTEWATAGHQPGEAFALLQPGRLRQISVPLAMIGAPIEVTAFGVGDGAGTKSVRVANGEALRPPSPVRLTAQAAGLGIQVRWIRRSRNGFGWIDGIDAPIGENSERYVVAISSELGTLEREALSTEASFTQADLQSIGPGAATISVAQIGDFARSRAAAIQIEIQ